jgi:hypothetical protein
MTPSDCLGDMPQNVNYAVKSAYALPLLEPYLGADVPEPNQPSQKPGFEDTRRGRSWIARQLTS